MSIFLDNNLLSYFIPSIDRGIFENDELYKNNQINFDLYLKSEASEYEKDICFVKNWKHGSYQKITEASKKKWKLPLYYGKLPFCFGSFP